MWEQVKVLFYRQYYQTMVEKGRQERLGKFSATGFFYREISRWFER